MFSDESRLSKLVRRVTREDDRDRRLTAIRQLKEFITLPENTKVGSRTIRKIISWYFRFKKKKTEPKRITAEEASITVVLFKSVLCSKSTCFYIHTLLQ